MLKCEFSKKLLIADYSIFGILLLCMVIFNQVDFSTVLVAWIAQLGLSTGAYYWKAKSDNRTKVPLKVIESLPKDMRDKIDLTQVITAIIQSE